MKRLSLSYLTILATGICTSWCVFASVSLAAPTYPLLAPPPIPVQRQLRRRSEFSVNGPYFNLPVTYNSRVKQWIQYYQGPGRHIFKIWLDRSYRYLPRIKPVLIARGLPSDLAYLAMIESGFSRFAVSSANAVGPWQFIKSTARRYGLRVSWWIDERRDVVKSTIAAATYLNHLHVMFHSWYLAAAAYNMGERRVQELIARYHTDNYWILSKKRDFPLETEQYIPKLIAAMLIAKAPGLYGFRDLDPLLPLRYDVFNAPGGTDLVSLARYLGLPSNAITHLNPEIIRGFIPYTLRSFKIRIPIGDLAKARRFAQSRFAMTDVATE